VDPDLRTALLAGGLVFCLLFAVLTISAAVDTGFDIFSVVSFGIIGMIAAGLIGAIRNPPPPPPPPPPPTDE
jgi:hypothetical protein